MVVGFLAFCFFQLTRLWWKFILQTHLILHDVTCDDWTDNARQCGHSIRQPHQYTGMLGGYVQVIHTEIIIETQVSIL
jgi:hypothetical protein